MSPFGRRIGCCLIALVISEMFGGTFARGDLEPVFTSVLHGNYVVVGTSISEERGSVLEPNDPITLTVDIPVGSTVEKAFLNWSYLSATPAPSFLADITVNGAPITAESTYESASGTLCRLDFELGRTFAYQVDLTDIVAAEIVNGHGVLTITEIVEDDDPNEEDGFGPLGEGVSLLVVYSEPTEPLRSINVYSGIAQTDFDVASFETPLSFVDPGGGAVRYAGGAVHFFLNALGPECLWDDFLLNGTAVHGVLGAGPNNDAWLGKLGPNDIGSNFYDHAEGDASSFMNVNDTQLTIGGQQVSTPFLQGCPGTVPIGNPGDCVGHSFAAIAFDYVPCPRLFVDGDAPGPPNEDGLTWGTAYRFLQDALDSVDLVCADTVEIWVAEGTYRPDETALSPTGTGAKSASFQLIDRVKVIGGFAGWETDVVQRDLVNNTTILSGDLGGNDIPNLADGIKCFTGPEDDCFCTALSC